MKPRQLKIQTSLGPVSKNTLVRGDCLEVMPNIKAGSIDLILTDPPYGITKCKWDSILPLDKMWLNLKRTIKTNGAIVMTASQPFTTTLISSNIKMFRQALVWEKNKSTGYLNANRMHLQAHEDIIIFYRKLPVYNPILGAGTAYNNKHKAGDNGQCYGHTVGGSERHNVITRYPRSVLKFDVDIKARYHPTQKPVALMEYLIKTYTNEGDTVLDFTMGGGPTGVACQNLNRDFIGIELDKGYFDIAHKRIHEDKELEAADIATAADEIKSSDFADLLI